MPRPLVPRSTLLAAFLCLAAIHAGAEKLTIERMFEGPDLAGASLRAAQISPDGRLVTYLKGKEDAKDRLDLWAYDIRAGRHFVLVDSSRLVPEERALSAEEEARRERQRISALSGIVEYSLAPDSKSVLVPLGGDLYVYDLARGQARRLTETQAFETDARFSPRGRYVSFVRDQNLWIIDVASRRERAITRDGGGPVSFGMAEFIAQEEMDRDTGYWWSPDDRLIAFARVDESQVEEVERFEIYARETRVVRQRYPFAGRRNTEVQLHVASLEGEQRTRIDLGDDPDVYLARVDWFPDGKSLAVQRQSRDQRRLDLLEADASTGRTRVLLSETSETWVPLHDELTFVGRGGQFIWASSRSGFKHLYLHERDGRLVRALTSGDWMVVGDSRQRAIRGLDEARGLLYFLGNKDTPIERHLYSVRLATGGEPRRLTQEPGWHSIKMSRDARTYLGMVSTPERPPSVSLRTVAGVELAALVPNRIEPGHPYAPYLPEHVPTEFGTLEASDGQTLHYQLLKPRPLEPGRRYPVIVDVYGGPGAQRVRRAWGNYFGQHLAQHGYVVFTLDNRGTGFRGTRFESTLHRRMGWTEVDDQVRGVRHLESLPFVDPERIGIFGWSYGGYMALMAAMRAPEAFDAAVAGAPFVDPALYDTHYTERYLLKPQENPEGYAASNVLTHAEGLRAPLLVIHGLADDNVLFTHSTALFARLQELGKPFEVMVYPGSKHGLLRHAQTGPHAYRMIRRFFDERFGR